MKGLRQQNKLSEVIYVGCKEAFNFKNEIDAEFTTTEGKSVRVQYAADTTQWFAGAFKITPTPKHIEMLPNGKAEFVLENGITIIADQAKTFSQSSPNQPTRRPQLRQMISKTVQATQEKRT